MKLRAVVLAASAATAVGLVATAIVMPAGADSPSTTPSTQDAVPAGVSPELMVAMQRDLKLSAKAARTRLITEDKAARTEAQLRQALGARFGGAWLSADAGTLVVGVTSTTEAE